MTALIYAVSELLVWLLAFEIPFLVIFLVLAVMLLLQQYLRSQTSCFKTHSRIDSVDYEYGTDVWNAYRSVQS